jgi:DNA-binding protein HU-beta
MTRAELVEKIQAERAGGMSRKAVAELLDAVFEEIGRTVKKSGRFSYPGFGTFTVKKRKARVGRNPQTGTAIKIPPTKTVAFKASPDLKDSL